MIGKRQGRRRVPCAERLEGRDLLSLLPLLAAHSHRAVAGPVQAEAAVGQPTPHEQARLNYVAKASGSFITGRGRLTDQRYQGLITATGGSTHSFHMQLNVRYFVPNDPSRPVTGVADVIPRNSSTTGSTLILDLTAPQTAGSTALPSRFTWTVDPTSAGIYTNAGGLGQGQGTLNIHYLRTSRGSSSVFSAGRAYVVIHGVVDANGIFSNI